MQLEQYIAISQGLRENMAKADYASFDPFDGLNSRLFKKTPLYNSSFFRLCLIQFNKRSPVNLRTLLLVPKMRNPKGIALVILGLLEDYRRTQSVAFLEEAQRLADWLLAHPCSRVEWGHFCWGYHFDWQSRAFYVPTTTPNIITTSYIARALFALADALNRADYRKAALDATQFISDRLYTEKDGQVFFAYIPDETVFVYNASLWGAAVVAQAGALLNDQALLAQAHTAVVQAVFAQRPDGSWSYGTRSHHQFIDSFHTGYNLEALCLYQQHTGHTEFTPAIGRGLKFYREQFFLQDGTPKYYQNNTYPIDMHSASQAILTLLQVGGTEADKKLAQQVLDWSIDNMYIRDSGFFKYQKTRWFDNRICYFRWTQAWVYYAMSVFEKAMPITSAL